MNDDRVVQATKALMRYDGIPPQLVEAVKVDLLTQYEDHFGIANQVVTLALSMTAHTRAGEVPTEYHMQHVALWQDVYSKCMDLVNGKLALSPKPETEGLMMEHFRNAIYNLVAQVAGRHEYDEQLGRVADGITARAYAGFGQRPAQPAIARQ